MPPPVFDNFLFDLLAQLTGGWVTDIKTMLAAMLVIGFTAMAGDILIEKIGGVVQQNRQAQIFAQNVYDSSKAFGEARSYRSLRDSSEEGSFDYDYYNSLYRAKLNESVSLSVKTGEPMSSGGSLFTSDDTDTHFDSLVSDHSFSVGMLEMDQRVSFTRQHVEFMTFFDEDISSNYSGDPGPTDVDRPYYDEDHYA